MTKILLLTTVACLSAGVALSADQDDKPTDAARKDVYGISERNPIQLGSQSGRSGPKVLHEYMDRLRGPRNEKVAYRRVGTCCEFETPRGLFGGKGVLEVWEVTYDGLPKPTKLFLNLYDHGEVSPPVGFLLKK